MIDCLDCFHCKVVYSKRILRCKTGLWRKEDGSEKCIKLGNGEIKFGRISPREIFSKANRCISFNSMD